MIVRAQVVITMNGAPITNGAVRIEAERIAEVGESSRFRAANESIIELDNYVLLPGLINAHCHLDYTCLRGKISPPQSFTDWIHAINAEKAKLTGGDYLQSIGEGFREAQRFGTTTIVNLEAFPELISRAQPTPLRTWWCPELIDVNALERTEQIVCDALELLNVQNNDGGFGLAPHALFTASAELFQRCRQIAPANDLLLTTHLAESREEMEMFRDAAGPLFEFLRSLGRSESDCRLGSPLQRFLQIIRDSSTSLRTAQNDKRGFRFAQNDKRENSARWIVAHLNELVETDFELLAKMPHKFSIAHCPRSHAYFRHSQFPLGRLRDLGFNICLATDSLATNSDLSLFAEMREFKTAHPRLAAKEILKMVTVNPARALDRATGLGKIAPGYFADMIALPISGSSEVHEQIIVFTGKVPWMMIGGCVL